MSAKIIATLTAAALAASPLPAAAAPLSLTEPPSVRAGADLRQGNNLESSLALIGLAAVAIVVLFFVIIDDDDDSDMSTSP